MTHSNLSIATQDKITTLTLNRPNKCNALDGALVEHLQEAFFAASQDDKTGLILLSGAGSHFCAGADINWMYQLAQSSLEQGKKDAEALASLLYQMYTFPKPIITLVQGSAMGGGLGLLVCSDIIIAAEDAQFCFSELKLGLVPAMISPYVLATIGERAARYYFLTAEAFAAQEALRLGLVQKLVPTEQLISTGLELSQTLLQYSPAALKEIKRLLPWVSRQTISPELSKKTAELLATMRLSKQGREGLKAFIEKRLPVWDD